MLFSVTRVLLTASKSFPKNVSVLFFSKCASCILVFLLWRSHTHNFSCVRRLCCQIIWYLVILSLFRHYSTLLLQRINEFFFVRISISQWLLLYPSNVCGLSICWLVCPQTFLHCTMETFYMLLCCYTNWSLEPFTEVEPIDPRWIWMACSLIKNILSALKF